MKKISKPSIFFSIILGFLIIEISFFICIIINSFNFSFYKMNQQNLNINDNTFKIINKDLKNPTGDILKFIKNDKNNLEFYVKNNIFNNKEFQHLKDVQILYNNFRIMNIFFVVLAIGLLIFLIAKKKYTELYIGNFISHILIIIFIILIGNYAYSNFSGFWNSFHKIIFNNNLWKLNFTDNLIILFPLSIFKKLVLNILISFRISFITIFIFNLFLFKKYLKK